MSPTHTARRATTAIVLAGIAALGLTTAPALSHAAVDAGPLATTADDPVFSDDFGAPAGAPVDPSRWRFDLGGSGWGNNELQYYTGGTANAAHDGQGNLAITARRENPADYQCHYGRCEYTSARLLTAGTFAQRYGRFEARIKVPRGQGIWPAFWMLGDDLGSVGWPNSGEIDIMENIGRVPNTVYGTIHGPGYSGSGGITGSRTIDRPLADDFHTYRVDWGPSSIVWYLDDVEYHRVDPGRLGGNRWVFDHPFFMILNVAVGGNWPGSPDGSTQFPQQMLVDYVRVWASGNTSPQPAPGETISSVMNGKCIDAPRTTDGQRLVVHDCHGAANQRWESVGGTLRTGGDLCMDVAGGSTADGAAIQIARCSGNPAQQFVFSAAGDLVNPQADKCVDIKDFVSTNGAPLQLWPCSGNSNQKWRRG
ncbi:MAG: family 16 glycosylhydrolase [Dermatophilaceae bacterium]